MGIDQKATRYKGVCLPGCLPAGPDDACRKGSAFSYRHSLGLGLGGILDTSSQLPRGLLALPVS